MSNLQDLQEEAEAANLSLGEIAESINGKADIDLQNTSLSDVEDYIIERGGVAVTGTGNGRVVG